MPTTTATFREILALRGRIVIFTPNALVGLKFEQAAERAHAQVVCTRGWADPYGPLLAWNRIHASREYGVLSCDQKRYIEGFKIHGTDFVWVGDGGDYEVHAWLFWRRMKALSLAGDLGWRWMVAEDAV